MQAQLPMTPAMGFFFARIFPWPFIISGVLVLFFGVRNVICAEESNRWPEVSGIIQSSSMKYETGGRGDGTYHAHVLYSFTLNGVNYSGDRVTFGDYGSSNPAHAQDVLNQYPSGKKVMVYYRPSEPLLCCLKPGINLFVWLMPVLGALFFVSGMTMAIFLPKVFKKYFASMQQS